MSSGSHRGRRSGVDRFLARTDGPLVARSSAAGRSVDAIFATRNAPRVVPTTGTGFRACCSRRGAPLRRFAGRTRAAALRPAFLPARISGSGARRCVAPAVRQQSRAATAQPPRRCPFAWEGEASRPGRHADQRKGLTDVRCTGSVDSVGTGSRTLWDRLVAAALFSPAGFEG
jgi:hypothetical protein